MRTEDAINFLLYSYFEITLGKNDVDNVIEAAIRRAYKDASSHVLSIDEKIKSDEDPKKRGIEIIAPQVRKLLAGELTYCIFHQETCQILKKKYEFISGKEGKREFTYGIAQKWVNMTLKYLWILGVLDDEYEDKLEVPIDSYMIKQIAKKCKLDMNHIKWSSWDDFDEYSKIQDNLYERLLNDAYTRIGWENECWIEESLKG